MQTDVSDAGEAGPREAESDAAGSGGQGEVERKARKCLCPRGDWRTNRERALANKCPAWIQHVADAAPVLLCHLYELSGGVGCRFAGYKSPAGSPPLNEVSDLTESMVTFDWHLGALHCSYQAGVPYKELADACDVYCEPGTPCDCRAAALIEVPATMARRLLRCDVPRRTAMAAAKRSEEEAITRLPYIGAKALAVVAFTPPLMVREARVRVSDFELQLPAQPPPTCTYLGQPNEDGGFAHASAEWSYPERGLLRTKVAFEWRAQRGSHAIVTRVEPPPNYGAVKKSQQVAIPDRFVTAKRLLDVFDRICAKSLAKLGKRKPPCTLISCQLLGSPKHWEAGPGDFRTIVIGDGSSIEHLALAHVKDEVYVCCYDADAWAAARHGKLSLKHFVIRDLGAGIARGRRQAPAARPEQHHLRELAAGDAAATAAIAAAGQLVATCARMEKWRWEAQATVKAEGFEPDPWLWSYAPQSVRPLVWALWTTIPAGNSWHGRPKRFLSATSVMKVLERGVFPVPQDLKSSPLAPIMAYRHPLYSESLFNPYRYTCHPPSTLQAWVHNHMPEDVHEPVRDNTDQPLETRGSSTVIPSPGAFGDADPETDADSSSDSSAEAEEPEASVPSPAPFNDTCESDVEHGTDPWELYPSDTDAETYEWFRKHKPETYEADYRKWRAQIEEYESCGYW